MLDIWRSTLHTRGLRAAPLATGLGLLALAVVFAAADRRLGMLAVLCGLYALLTASGIVGQDVSEGTVQLLLARPVTRAQYLAGRLLGALTLTVGFVLAALAAGALAARADAAAIVSVGAAALSASVWTVVLVFFFSTLLPGRADTLAALALFLVAGSLHSARTFVESDMAVRLIEAVWDNVCCIVVLGGATLTPAAITDLLRWASNSLLAVLAAVLVFNRRQFGYAD